MHKYFVWILLFIGHNLSAHKPIWLQVYDRAGDSLIGKSCSAIWAPIDVAFHGMQKASGEYQQLAQQAQKRVGIQEGSFFSVYQGEKIETRTHGIMVNEQDLQEASYGAKRLMMLQQAIHRKYNDAGMVELISFSGMMPAISKVHQYMPVVRGRFFITLGICMVCDMTFRSIIEKPLARRAAVEGLAAIDCESCLDQVAESKEFMKKSYIEKADIDLLKREVPYCCCEQHKVS